MQLTKEFETFVDTDRAMDASAVVAGFLVSEAAIAVADDGETMGFDLPGEAGALAAVYATSKVPRGYYGTEMNMGAWAALVIRLLERFGVRNKVSEVLA